MSECGWIVGSMAEVAKAFDVAYRSVSTWKRNGMPIEEDGRFNLIKIAYWKYPRDHWNESLASKRDSSQLAELEVLEKRLSVAQKELKLREAAGQLVDRDSAIAEQRRQFHALRTQLEDFPHRLAGAFPDEMKADVMAECGHQIMLLLQQFRLRAVQDEDERKRLANELSSKFRRPETSLTKDAE